MEIASAPTTPNNPLPPHVLRRSFTAPIKSTGFSKVTAPFRATEGVGAETLFAHNTARIVSFKTIPSDSRRHSSVGLRRNDLQDEPIGTLPWASRTEITIAAGPLRIYRVLGSVAFLNSGDTLRPILAKSQCWCVDGQSKFVLRVNQNSYYRIELPAAGVEDGEKVEELKKVLANLLQYEVTPCPFKRGFTVDLPEPPRTPVRKRAWKPQQQAQPVTESDSSEVEGIRSNAVENPRPQGLGIEAKINNEPRIRKQLKNAENDTVSSLVATLEAGAGLDQNIKPNGDVDQVDEDSFEFTHEEPDTFKTPTRPKSLRTGRAITAPPQISLRTTPPSATTSDNDLPTKVQKAPSSLSSSGDSFHSFHSPISPLPPSPPYSDPPSPSPRPQSDEDITLTIPRLRSHKRETSETTVTVDSPSLWDMTYPLPDRNSTTADNTASPIPPRTPTLISDTASQQSEDHCRSPATPSPSSHFLRHRPFPSHGRAHSPLPSPVNLYHPSTHLSGHHITTAILQKTCSLLLGPPVQLIALMLNIAAKIANGAFQERETYYSFGYGEGRRRIPCSWDFDNGEDVEDRDSEGEEVWEEDDYGVSLGYLAPSSGKGKGKGWGRRDEGGSWEID